MVASASDNTILAVDVEGFGKRDRRDSALVAVRAAVHDIVETACTRAGVLWKRCYSEGTGDGVFVAIPPDVPKRLLSTPLPHELATAIREHNDTCQEQAHVRLRAAVHAGQVQRDAHGVAGSAVNMTFRLLDSRALRSALARSPGVLAMIASEWFFNDVIHHDPDAGAYRRVRVRVKETRGHAWVTCPDSPPRVHTGRRRVFQAATGLVIVGGLTTAAAFLTPLQPAGAPNGPEALAPPEPLLPGASGTPNPENGITPAGGTRRTTDPQPARPPATSRSSAPPQPTPITTSTSTTPTSSQTPRSDTDPVEEERSVGLSTEPGQESVEMDSWRQNHDRSGDLQVDATGVITTLGAQLAVVEDAANPTRDRCRQVQNWTTRVDFAQLRVGSKLCARTTGGRHAMLDVKALPDSPGSDGKFVFYGRTWEL